MAGFRWILPTALLGCSGAGGQAPAGEPAFQDATSVLRAAVDESTDPWTVAVTLRAADARKRYGAAPETPVWAYNGTVPGPVIEAAVGQVLVAGFENALPEPTTVHWHGVRLPATMDGSLAMQSPVLPGGGFRYEFTLKDAGLYWFHPHMRTDIQIQKGLYGVLRVRGRDEPASDEEHILVLDDIRLNADGSIPEYLDDNSRMMGREGNTLLVNGVANASLSVRRGATVRLRILNTANGRFFNLHLDGIPLRVVGTDGGRIPAPYDTDTLLVGPAERYDVFITSPRTGDFVDLVNLPYSRGHLAEHADPMRVARVFLSGPVHDDPAAVPASGPRVVRLPRQPVDFPLVFDEATRDGEVVFTINGDTFPNVPTLVAPHGSNRVFELKNDSDMDHPFHLHGFFFQVLSRQGVLEPSERLANKDTIILPAEQVIEVVTHLNEPGTWMYHCHINEHSEHGMMAELAVR